MPTPPKSTAVLEQENKSNRTKSEIAQRKKAEEASMTGVKLKERNEVKQNEIAHKEFNRVNSLLKKIGKNDAIYEAVINRYCILQAECVDYEQIIKSFYKSKSELQEEYRGGKCGDPDDGGMTSSQYYKLLSNIQKNIIDTDKQIQAKRKMLFDIERENGMTIAAALRSIPKKEDKTNNPLLEALKDDSTE